MLLVTGEALRFVSVVAVTTILFQLPTPAASITSVDDRTDEKCDVFLAVPAIVVYVLPFHTYSTAARSLSVQLILGALL